MTEVRGLLDPGCRLCLTRRRLLHLAVIEQRGVRCGRQADDVRAVQSVSSRLIWQGRWREGNLFREDHYPAILLWRCQPLDQLVIPASIAELGECVLSGSMPFQPARQAFAQRGTRPRRARARPSFRVGRKSRRRGWSKRCARRVEAVLKRLDGSAASCTNGRAADLIVSLPWPQAP